MLAEVPADRALLRMGAVSIVLGTLISNVAGFFHGGGAHPEDLAATLPAYAAHANWEVVHLAQFVGDALMLVGFLALYRSIVAVAGTGASAALARMGTLAFFMWRKAGESDRLVRTQPRPQP